MGAVKRCGAGVGVVFVAAALSACGGGAGARPAEGAGGAGASGGQSVAGDARHHGEGHHHHEGGGGGRGHHALPAGPVHDFHEVLAPIWHSPESPERAGRACAQASAMQGHADAIVAGQPPEGARGREDGYRASATALRDAVIALGAECSGARAAVPARLEAVHTAFHRLIEHLEHH